jgi:hypothetical protein
MIEDSNNKQRSKLSALISGGDEQKLVGEKASPLTRLPQKTSTSLPPDDTPGKMPPPAKKITPTQPKLTVQTEGKSAPVSSPVSGGVSRARRFSFGPPFWTITGIISLFVNGILIAILIGLLNNLRTLQLDNVVTLPKDLVSGLYTNFEKMDRAHIRTNVVVDTTIPVKFDLALNQQTNVVLSQDVRIDNARVTVNTGGLNITNALTAIVLPAGTSLPVFLNLTVPVDQSVPVTLNVPVDIALKDTDLHEPFEGLRNVIQPLYCVVAPNATNLDGQAVCVNAP